MTLSDPLTERTVRSSPAVNNGDFSLLALGTVLLRGRLWIIVLAFLGAVISLGVGLNHPRLYASTATFIPQGSDAGGGSSGLALAASQFGIRLPNSSNAWTPPVYIQLLHTRSILEPVVSEPFAVTEEGGKKLALWGLLNIKAESVPLRLDRTLAAVRELVDANEVKDLNAVHVTVTTRWPSVSLEIANRLVTAVNQFNLETRKSQAAAERKFVEAQTAIAQDSLRRSENRLQDFMQSNRNYMGSPELNFQHGRLERDMMLKQQSYSSLVVSLEEARIREVRDIPVLTLLDVPRLPLVGEPRHLLQRIVMGGLAGAVLGALVALITNAFSVARRAPDPTAQEFFASLESATPRLLRKSVR